MNNNFDRRNTILQEKEVHRPRHVVDGVEGVTGQKNKQGIELSL